MRHTDIEKNLTGIIREAAFAHLKNAGAGPAAPREINPELEIPKEKSHGDISTNIALKYCKQAKLPPLDLAQAIKIRIDSAIGAHQLGPIIEKVEVKAPGFVNFFLSFDYLSKSLLEIKRRKDNYGRGSMGRGIKLNIEFVSANPTGPLTIAHGRQAAIGDSLARILGFLGYKVTREYYLNDEGTQMDILGRSIRVRYLKALGRTIEFPTDGYKGGYVYEIAKAFESKNGAKYASCEEIAPFREFGLKWILNDIRKDLNDFDVKFDVWFSQRSLRKSGRVEKALDMLRQKGHIYEKDGAVWFKSQPLGDDKDRVVVKSDGALTYLAPDIAYHLEKYRRGFKSLVDIWGPDHHGYIPRLKAAIKALGFSQESLSVLIVQLATLYRNAQVVSMSTRAGEFVTLREVSDEVGKDVARFCFLMRKISSHLDFDMDIVKKQSMDNPVYYIQYAHARIWSILDFSRKTHKAAKFNSRLLKEPEELDLIRTLRQFPQVVGLSGRHLEPYVIVQYLQEIAGIFHSFYTKHRVISDDENLTRSRLVLVDCTRIVLANGLRLLGVSLPKKM